MQFRQQQNQIGFCLKRLIVGILTLLLAEVSAQQNPVIFPYEPDSIYVAHQLTDIRSVSSDYFSSDSFHGANGIEISYRLYSPDQFYSYKKNLPLVVIFHGSGAVGNDNTSQLGLLSKLFAHPKTQAKYPAYVLVPQFPTRSSDYTIDSTRQVLTSTPRACLYTALNLIDSLTQSLPIDSKRIYLAGYSMGGSTVVNAMIARPDLFAAGISIAGIPQFDQANRISQIPLLLIHGIEDDENSIDSDEHFFQEFNRRNLQFWKFENIKHDILTTPQLLGDKIPEWLFKHKK